MDYGFESTSCIIYLRSGDTIRAEWGDFADGSFADAKNLERDFLHFRKGKFSPKVMALFLGFGGSQYLPDEFLEAFSLPRPLIGSGGVYAPDFYTRLDNLDDSKLEDLDKLDSIDPFYFEGYCEFRKNVSSAGEIRRILIIHEEARDEDVDFDENGIPVELEQPHTEINIDFQTGEVEQCEVYW